MFSQTKDTQVLGRQTRGLAVGYPDELRLRAVNTELLRSISAAAEGTFEPTPEAVFDVPLSSASRAVPLWPLLTAAAVLFFVLDVALRRIDLGLIIVNRRRVSLSKRIA